MLEERKCIVVKCDGCGVLFDDAPGHNQEYPILFPDEEQAELWMECWEDESNWEEQPDGRLLCGKCSAPLSVEETCELLGAEVVEEDKDGSYEVLLFHPKGATMSVDDMK